MFNRKFTKRRKRQNVKQIQPDMTEMYSLEMPIYYLFRKYSEADFFFRYDERGDDKRL